MKMGRAKTYVLSALSDGDSRTIKDLASGYEGALNSIQAAVDRLAAEGLVDVGRDHNQNARAFRLTQGGQAIHRALRLEAGPILCVHHAHQVVRAHITPDGPCAPATWLNGWGRRERCDAVVGRERVSRYLAEIAPRQGS